MQIFVCVVNKTKDINMKLLEPIKIKCKECFSSNLMKDSELPKPEICKYERNLGYETCYTLSIISNCKTCNNSFVIGINIFEYPAGILNYVDIVTSGCLFFNKAKFEL